MTVVTGEIVGKEQLILLPVENKVFPLLTDPPGQVNLQTGREAIVVSGYFGIKFTNAPAPGPPYGIYLDLDVDDDQVFDWEVRGIVGPLWRSVIQVSASVSVAGIGSLDSDIVDHSRWVVMGCAWEEAPVDGGMRILLKPHLRLQGAGNGWVTLSYQVVATGWLRRMPTPDEVSADLS